MRSSAASTSALGAGGWAYAIPATAKMIKTYFMRCSAQIRGDRRNYISFVPVIAGLAYNSAGTKETHDERLHLPGHSPDKFPIAG